MGEVAGIPSESVGEFPLNLVGKEMIFWREQGLPYPEEVCVFWNMVMSLRGFREYGDQTYGPAKESTLSAMGLSGYEREWFFVPANYHAGLRQGRKDMQVTPKMPPKVYPKKNPHYTVEEAKTYAEEFEYPFVWADGSVCLCDSCIAASEYKSDNLPPPSDLGLSAPNPPRIAQLQVSHTSDNGQVTVFPLVSAGLVLLKETRGWRYSDTATIFTPYLDDLIRELTELKYNLEDNY